MPFIPQFAPGCFGSALAFDQDNMACKACPFAADCKPLHDENLVRLRAHFNVQTKAMAAREKVRPSGESQPALAVPRKTQELIDRLDRGQFCIIEKMQKGENPFPVGVMEYMRVTCHLLMKLAARNGRLTQPLLSAALINRLGWQKGTSDAHARMALQALSHIGAIDLVEGVAKLRSN